MNIPFGDHNSSFPAVSIDKFQMLNYWFNDNLIIMMCVNMTPHWAKDLVVSASLSCHSSGVTTHRRAFLVSGQVGSSLNCLNHHILACFIFRLFPLQLPQLSHIFPEVWLLLFCWEDKYMLSFPWCHLLFSFCAWDLLPVFWRHSP